MSSPQIKMKHQFKYKDEQDKSYGISGMAISLVAWDEEDLLVSVSLDSEPKESITLDPQFYFQGNPIYNAKLAWNQIVKHFTITTAMALSNVMCRSYLQKHSALSHDALNELKKLVREEGREHCSLENDECDTIFNKCYTYFDRLFAHSGVQAIATDFAKTLAERRQMSSTEVLDKLQQLSNL
jgi:hypothetical protein